MTTRKSKPTTVKKKTKTPNTWVSKIRKYSAVAYGFLKKERDIYPVIAFSIMPIIIFWAQQNIHELNLTIMGRAFLLALLAGLAIYGACYLLLQRKAEKDNLELRKINRFKASVIAVVTILISFSYGQVYSFYQKFVRSLLDAKTIWERHTYLLILLAVLFVIFVRLFTKRVKFSKTIQNYLAAVATVLLLINLYPLALYWIKNNKWNNISYDVEPLTARVMDDEKKPDIYYFIFDRYANGSTLKDTYGFDNSPFLNFLKNNGFYVASDSAANYPFTPFSLASSLNISYLPDRYIERTNSSLLTGLYEEIENSTVRDFLDKQGYTTYNVGPWWDATKYNRFVDHDLFNPMGPVILNRKFDLPRHELLLFQDTILWPFFKQPLRSGNSTLLGTTFPSNDIPNRAIQAQTNFRQFDLIKSISKQKGPKYTFAHFLLPHEPYVFDEKCEKHRNKNEPEAYIRQLKCANTLIKDMVEQILSNSESEPIIIIQADEGPYPKELREDSNLNWREVEDRVLFQKTKIINAYHFPGKGHEKLYPNISPVNSFRVVFNEYFGTNVPLLQDKHYISESNKTRRFDMYEITERFKK